MTYRRAEALLRLRRTLLPRLLALSALFGVGITGR
jgi:hypothetical protein